ncbi:helix-turn-helix domain-containing protein [Lacrimispora sp.]|uniref:helix-turn-helix domain-containing protein n=1 Tax=Lacrimispora sp. TaxID=2719234 RepID=UPI0028ABEE5E|nr:helix-turn-helix domain-containing protein [Lacrimispora sp.]
MKKQEKKGGYGIVYQEIMRNSDIPPESKAIYAYLCSFAGSGETCFPRVEMMRSELSMGKQRFNKFMDILISLKVVIRERERDGNLLGYNVYRLTHEVNSP